MNRFGVLISLLLIVVSPVTSQEPFFSGDLSSDKDYVKVQENGIDGLYHDYGSRSVSINISSSERKFDSLETYSSYRIDIKGNNVISMKLVMNKSSLRSWADQKGIEIDDLSIITEDKAVIDIKSGSNYSADIIISDESATVSVVGGDDISGGYQLAVNPDKSVCRIYWNPEPNYTAVDSCEGQIATGTPFLGLSIMDIGLSIISVILISSLAVLMIRERRKRSDEEDIEATTDEIIHKMENGDIPKDQELLLKLKEANERAFKNQYEEASEILEEVKAELESKNL